MNTSSKNIKASLTTERSTILITVWALGNTHGHVKFTHTVIGRRKTFVWLSLSFRAAIATKMSHQECRIDIAVIVSRSFHLGTEDLHNVCYLQLPGH